MKAIRVGFGYDVHRWVQGRALVLGGVQIPHESGLDGHSDADVVLHALCDALLGAAGLRDIGHHFPNTDERFRGIESTLLLKQTVDLIQTEGWQVNNVDITLTAERPKIGPYLNSMKARIAELLHVETNAVGIKATTNEKLGFVGREEGACAYAVALLIAH
jgi:2-C-methyl-D-erythritol 2,4-cyclodiphosphate synthase